ncbi:MAG: hypothetical protein PWQ41_525 [Bacillota bacterium]|nr:hypothetical protein [Bacillota bacterium]MDK2924751.1 hypothetical protein [Bacillota bacterium]
MPHLCLSRAGIRARHCRTAANAVARRLACLISFLLLLAGAVPAQAQAPGGNFGIYLTGRERTAEFLQALSFRDLPSGPAALPILRLAARGVLRGDGSGRILPAAVVSRQEAVVALVRLLEWEKEAGAPAATALSGNGVAAWAQPAVSLAVARGLTSGANGSGRQEPWDAPATREEVAAWMVRALRLKAGILPADSAGILSTYADGNAVSAEYAGDVEQALALGLVQGPTPYRLAPKGGITRAELARMLDALDRLLPPGRTTWQVGTVAARIDEKEELGGRPVRSTLWQITGPGGTAVALKLTTTSTGQPLRGVVVMRDGRLTVGGLAVGQNIRYLVSEGGVVPFVEVLGGTLTKLDGLVEEVNLEGHRLVVQDESGVRHTFFVAPEAAVTVGGQGASPADLIPGQRVTVEALAGTAWSVAAVVSEPPYAASPPARVVSGSVRYVDEKHIVVVLPSGVTAQYEVSAGTKVTAGGRSSSLSAVKPGDRIELELPGPDATWVERINVAGRAGRVDALYRGYLAPFSPRGNEVVLSSPERLEGETWQNVGAAVLRLPLAADADIWLGDAKVDLAAAEKLQGRTAYVAVTEGFGRPEALRIVIKEGQEQAYGGKVERVNPSLGELELPAGQVALSPGAIVLKDGRLADPYALAEDDSVQVLVDKGPTGSLGLVVRVLGRPEVFPDTITVYKGDVEAVGPGAWTIDHYYTLVENEWDYHGRSQSADLGLNQDTFILSLLGDAPAVLSAAEFRQGFYQNLYDEATALAVTQGEETLGIGLWPESQLGAERLTSGRMAGIYEDENTEKVTLKMENVLNYSPANGTWQGGSATEEVRADKSLVVKEGRCGTWTMLQEGDELVMLRQGQTALLILVKE